MIFTELDSNGDNEREVAQESEPAVEIGGSKGKVMRNLVLSCEEILIEGATNSISSNHDLPPREVLDVPGHCELSGNDCKHLWELKMGKKTKRSMHCTKKSRYDLRVSTRVYCI